MRRRKHAVSATSQIIFFCLAGCKKHKNQSPGVSDSGLDDESPVALASHLQAYYRSSKNIAASYSQSCHDTNQNNCIQVLRV